MLHNEVRRLAQDIGDELQTAADDASRVVKIVEGGPGDYLSPEDWAEEIRLDGDELVSSLDILANRCIEARDQIDAAMRSTSTTAASGGSEKVVS